MGRKGKRRPKHDITFDTEAFFTSLSGHGSDCVCSDCCSDSWASIPLEKPVGGHALIMTGINWNKGGMTVRNSWGYPKQGSFKPRIETDEEELQNSDAEVSTWPLLSAGVAEYSFGVKNGSREFTLPFAEKLPDRFQWSDNVARYETKPQHLSTSAEVCSVRFASCAIALGLVAFIAIGIVLALRKLL